MPVFTEDAASVHRRPASRMSHSFTAEQAMDGMFLTYIISCDLDVIFCYEAKTAVVCKSLNLQRQLFCVVLNKRLCLRICRHHILIKYGLLRAYAQQLESPQLSKPKLSDYLSSAVMMRMVLVLVLLPSGRPAVSTALLPSRTKPASTAFLNAVLNNALD